MAVDSFAEKMTGYYDQEADRREEGLRALNKILSLRGGNKLMAGSIGTCRSDGHYDGPHEAASCVVEFRNELVDISSMAMVELTAYAAHSHMQAMEHSREVFSSWRVPCLGLAVVGKLNISGLSYESDMMYIIPGPHVTFYAIIFHHQWRVVSLTPTLLCITSACEGDDQKGLYAAFSGALDLLGRIDENAARFISALAPPTIEHADRKFPYISSMTLPTRTSGLLGFISTHKTTASCTWPNFGQSK